MSTNAQNNDSQEIDLSQVSKRIGRFFEGLTTSFFRTVLFLKRNKIIVAVLVILGVLMGFYLDKTSKSYDNQLIVMPNFNSVDYLYTKVDLIDSKIKSNDTMFLKNVVGIKNPKKFTAIEITPITDVYRFVENKPENFEMIKLMAEGGDIKKVVNENVTSKNYPYHKISFTTSIKTNQESTVEPLLIFFNKSEYYTRFQKEYTKNINKKIKENDSIIGQINSLLNAFSKEASSSSKSDKLVYYNENSQLNDVIKTKNEIIYDQASNRIQLVNIDKIIKECSVILNINTIQKVNGKMKFILPVIFIFFFLMISKLISFYKKGMAKAETQN